MLCGCSTGYNSESETEGLRAERIEQLEEKTGDIDERTEAIEENIQTILDEMAEQFIIVVEVEADTAYTDSDISSAAHSVSPYLWIAYNIDTEFGSYEDGYRELHWLDSNRYYITENHDGSDGFTDFGECRIENGILYFYGMSSNLNEIALSSSHDVPDWFTAKYWVF